MNKQVKHQFFAAWKKFDILMKKPVYIYDGEYY